MTGHVFDQLPALALGALDPEERESVETHLAGCELCRLELDSISETLNSIPVALEPVLPSPELKSRVLAEARNIRPNQASFAEGVEYAVTGVSAPDIGTSGSLRGPLAMRSRSPSPLLLLGLAVVLFAAGLTLGRLFQQGLSPEQRYERAVAAAVASGERVVSLRPSAGTNVTVRMSLAWTSTGRTSLIVGPSSAPPTGHIYQLWFIRSPHLPVSAGVFDPGTSTVSTTPLPQSAKGYLVSAMTVEPGPRGSTQPTAKPFAEATLRLT